MRMVLLHRHQVTGEVLKGRILCQDLHDAEGRIVFRKGQVLQPNDGETLLSLSWEELHLIEPAPDEVLEDEAGRRLAQVVAGPGVSVGTPSAGHWPLHAAHRGILTVDTSTLDRINHMEGITVFTLLTGWVVAEGDVVARVKVIPFVIRRAVVEAVEALVHPQGRVVWVQPFRPMRVGAIVQETLDERARHRLREVLAKKIAWFGSDLVHTLFVPPAEASIAETLKTLLHQGVNVILTAGARGKDPLDPMLRALDRIGARMEQYGVPAHPGSFFWLAYAGDVPILGVPSCSLFSKATVVDLVLPRIFAGDRVNRTWLIQLGHGGLLTRDALFRLPPYQPSRSRGALE